jgi:hypothetical protein
MTKETALFILLFFMVFSLIREVREKGPGLPALRPAGAQALGALVAGLTVTAPIAVMGGFPAMFDALVVYTLDYVGESTMLERIEIVAKTPLFLLLMAGPWVFFGAFGMYYALQRKTKVDGVLLAGWFFAAWIGIIAAGRFYLHYYVMLTPALSLLLPLGVAYFRENLGRRMIQVAAVVCLPVAFIATIYLHGLVYAQPDGDGRHMAKYAHDEWNLWEIESQLLADWITERTGPDDYIYNLGFHSELYFYADRESPTRYLFDHPFRAGDKYIDDAISDLEANPPLYIFDSAKYEYRLDQWGYPLPEVARLRVQEDVEYYGQRVTEWIRENYDYLGKVYYADAYRLKGEGAAK